MSARSTKSLLVLSLLALVTGLIVWSQYQTVRAETVKNITQDGPALGDTIDLLSWRDRKGRTLREVNGKRSLALVAFVTPNCDSCAKTKDAMQTLRERAAKANIAYYVLMIPGDTDTQQYFSYADSLKIDAESFVWSNTDVKAPATLTNTGLEKNFFLAACG